MSSEKSRPERTPGARRYDGSGRRRDAEQRRARVLRAAHELFLEQGYGATSIEQIARAAGSSAPTVYAAFGNKAGILARAIDLALAGDLGDTRLMDRPAYAAALAADGPDAVLRRVVSVATATHERSGRLIVLAERAAGGDPAVAELAETLRRQLRLDAARVVDAIAPAHLSADHRARAVDVLAVVASAWTWHRLVVEAGWSRADYERWLVDAVQHELVRAP